MSFSLLLLMYSTVIASVYSKEIIPEFFSKHVAMLSYMHFPFFAQGSYRAAIFITSN